MPPRTHSELIETAASTYLTVPQTNRGEFVADLLDEYHRLSGVDTEGEVTQTSLDFGAAVLARADDLELTGASGLVLT